MNGDITNLEGIVATQGDYEKYGDTHQVMMMFFKRDKRLKLELSY